MVYDENNTEFGMGTGQPDGQRIVVLPDPSNRPLSKADRARGVTRSLVADALTILNRMAKDCQKTPELLENYCQLHHCLDYLKRFCDGKV